jgi:hypothetical protein
MNPLFGNTFTREFQQESVIENAGDPHDPQETPKRPAGDQTLCSSWHKEGLADLPETDMGSSHEERGSEFPLPAP